MIGLVIVTHGELANSFISGVEIITGKQPHLKAICIQPDSDMEEQRHNILQTIKEVDQGKGVILLTDLFGGTPSNLAISVLGMGKVEVIAGINLPMLLKLISVRKSSLQEAVLQAQEAGRKQIHIASSLLDTKPSVTNAERPSDLKHSF